jgi:transcriptional regulator with XRE-family HTH domain
VVAAYGRRVPPSRGTSTGTEPAMPDGEYIGTAARISVHRNAHGLSQHQLAHRAGISYSLLTKVEAGHRPATPAVVAACARAMGVEPGALSGPAYMDMGQMDAAALPTSIYTRRGRSQSDPRGAWVSLCRWVQLPPGPFPRHLPPWTGPGTALPILPRR